MKKSVLLTISLFSISSTLIMTWNQPSAQGDEKPKRTYLKASDLPKPYATPDAGNGGQLVAKPDGVELQMPKGFKAEVIADKLKNPRWVTVASNGDIFVSETGGAQITLLRLDKDGKVMLREVFIDEINRPFGTVFLNDKLYVATPKEVLCYDYKAGQTKAEGDPKVIVGNMPTEGHTTRSLAFNPKNAGLKAIFISLQSTLFSVILSLTVNLSLGERPVNLPVCTANAPISVMVPWFSATVFAASVSGVSFQFTILAFMPKVAKLEFGFLLPISCIFFLFV